MDIDFLSRRRDAEQVAGVGGVEAEQQAHRVALGDDFLHHVHAVGERGAQVHAGRRPALFARVVGQVEIPAADAIVVGRQHLFFDLRHFLRALGFLEAQRDGFVAFQFCIVAHSSFQSLFADG